ncbi:MAG: hypothetical protein A2Y90_00825 [Chloroflexi bacterium RBG_13_52_12]|nr:MAG: hypothetical protein A2Y90_00825 [Chloroflexi bacterium RBG_13_52_12]
MTNHRSYRCAGRKKAYVPVERCQNKGWSAEKLENIVWAELEQYLSKPEMVISQLETKSQNTDQLSSYEVKLEQIERQLKAVNREQHQLLQWALKDFPADQVEAENKRLNKAKETLNIQKVNLQTQIKMSQDAEINLPKMKDFIQLLQDQIARDDYNGKRQALEMLGIVVWLDGEHIEITGVLDSSIVHSPLSKSFPLSNNIKTG